MGEHQRIEITGRKDVKFLSGTEVLVAALLEQAARDAALGLRTGGFVSGYRGSPLGHVDEEMWAAEAQLSENNITFQPGVNEDLAATAVWGSQQVGFFKDPKVQGVFGLWYSKGPGLDRSGDALRHANLWGTSELGGVVMAVGDDPMARSSSIQQQSELALSALSIPTFSASSVQDIFDYCLIGWQLSRYSGVWTAIKMTSDIAESSSFVACDPTRNTATVPRDHQIAPPGVHIRWPDTSVDQDERLNTRRLPAVHAFVAANRLNRTTFGQPENCRLGIIAHGKVYTDTIEALANLGIDEWGARSIGLAVFKLGVIWPLEPSGLAAFAVEADELIVLEEGRAFVEPQVKATLFDRCGERAIQVSGKAVRGEPVLPSHGELTPALIARAIAKWLEPYHASQAISKRLAELEVLDSNLAASVTGIIRAPHFCSGCPHNTSTKVPEGSDQLAGIGCHTLAMFMERGIVAYPQMGGEGAAWVGASPFVETEHVFVNVGDGTFYHSGSLAIRQAIAAKVNATYKILYNDAVAMTGGQPVDGPISVHAITHQMKSEGAARVLVVSDNPDKFDLAEFAPGTSLHHRDELTALQLELREAKGVSVIVYEQTCATELRRRRKRGKAIDPQKRVVINDRVCEGCGDCGVQSNCLSIQPLDTEFGRKRTIDQSSCNKDFSCVKGFCPSFVTIEGGALAKPTAAAPDANLFEELPTPAVVDCTESRAIVVAGIGGTGVVTISKLLGMAAESEGLAVQILDLTGMSQKFGAVFCHIKIGQSEQSLGTPRIASSRADVLLGADLVASAQKDALSLLQLGLSRVVINDHRSVTGTFTRDTEFQVPRDRMASAIETMCGQDRASFYNVTSVSEALTGDSIGANLMLVGLASQMGLLPVSADAIEAAVVANRLSVPYNLHAFRLGRLWAHDPQRIDQLLSAQGSRTGKVQPRSLEEVISDRAAELTAYQNQAYAERYMRLVKAVQSAENVALPGCTSLTEAVAQNFFKLMAYKDEYEVARLYVGGPFLANLKAQFTGSYRLRFHLAPPLLARRDKVTGKLIKREFGAWVLIPFRILARLKFLRGTAFDPFGRGAERRQERRLIDDFEASMSVVTAGLTPENHASAIVIAKIPEKIRGYGHVKEASIIRTQEISKKLVAEFTK
ncbi:indolepyruvate ferredoxin oxidoreductase family protein [Aquisediminimonas profunda]|uniref:indolepyruvate ferredoxin oxidoreductase family protein n=1 Tax=Aquisediminimonas profunda TaxID=1550733 RepID=UPI001C62687E|nr:indolepyruvate ferredoxin oxidoreductase family protein [Aquisediminimonas profunda]